MRASSPREARALSLLVVGCWGLLMLVVGALWATAVFGLSLAGR